jgi:phage baseplate assembly protein V
LLINKAFVNRVDDTTDIQTLNLDGLSDEVLDTVEHVQPYGFTANPPEDTQAVVAEVGDSRDNMICLVVGDGANRPNGLTTNEVELWSRDGQSIKLESNGKTTFNGGGRGAARLNDTIVVDATTDPAFITWIAQVSGFINLIAQGTITNIPTSVAGKINSASGKVEISNE